MNAFISKISIWWKALPVTVRTAVLWVCIGIVVGAGITGAVLIPTNNRIAADLTRTSGELADARRTLVDAGKRSDELGRLLAESRSLASASAGGLESALREASASADSANRIVGLTRAIRSVVNSLKSIAEIGASTGVGAVAQP